MPQIEHPQSGPDGWMLKHLVYPGSPGEIAVGILEKAGGKMLGLRWCEGDHTRRTWSGEATGWFLVPFTFASAIGRSLIEMEAAGFGLDPAGFQSLVAWLVEDDGVQDCLCY